MVAYRYIVWGVAGACAAGSCLITLYMVYKHLRNYTQPNLQRYIVRILYMAPIYSICSLLALIFIDVAKYFDLARDCYEAYLLYSFFCLLIAFINEYSDEKEEEAAERGEKSQPKVLEFDSDSDEESRPLYTVVDGHKVYYGEERVIYVLKTKPKMGIGDGCHPIPTPCCNCKFGTGRTFLRWTKRCILQFVIFKPLLSAITVPLDHYGLYAEGSIDFTKGYVYIAFLENMSITISMYFLVLFYHSIQEELAPFRPIAKFLCIKAIILFAFWQSIIIGVLEHYEVFHGSGDYTDEDVAASILDLLISVEMLIISIAMIWIFGYDTYRDPHKTSMLHHPVQGAVPLVRNLLDTFDQRDVMKETVKSFKFGSHKAEYLGKAILTEEEKERIKSRRPSQSGPGSFVGDNSDGGYDRERQRWDRDRREHQYRSSRDRRSRRDKDKHGSRGKREEGKERHDEGGEGYDESGRYEHDRTSYEGAEGRYDEEGGSGYEGRAGDRYEDRGERYEGYQDEGYGRGGDRYEDREGRYEDRGGRYEGYEDEYYDDEYRDEYEEGHGDGDSYRERDYDRGRDRDSHRHREDH